MLSDPSIDSCSAIQRLLIVVSRRNRRAFRAFLASPLRRCPEWLVIRKGDTANATVPESVRSNLTTILGRAAAYQDREVTWKELMERREKFEFDLKSLKA